MNDAFLRAAFEPARRLEPTDAEIARALERGRRRRFPRGLIVLFTTLLVGASAAYAIEPIRGALGTIVNGEPPGRPVRPDDNAPEWLNRTGSRVIAESEGVKLYVVREPDGQISFGLDGSVGFTGSVENFREEFRDRAVRVLGPGAPHSRGRRPLFGITARTVKRVELRYARGAPLAAVVDGGFVLLADMDRPLRELVAFDAAGRVLERTDVSYIDLRVCRDVRGCPPGKYETR